MAMFAFMHRHSPNAIGRKAVVPLGICGVLKIFNLQVICSRLLYWSAHEIYTILTTNTYMKNPWYYSTGQESK